MCEPRFSHNGKNKCNSGRHKYVCQGDQMNEFSGLFIEARLLSGPMHLSHYVGVSVAINSCSFSLLTRTSGMLVVVGVGSYLAYRLCVHYLGKDILRSLLKQAKEELLVANSYPSSRVPLQYFNLETDDLYSSILVDDGLTDSDDECSDVQSFNTKQTLLSPDATPGKMNRNGDVNSKYNIGGIWSSPKCLNERKIENSDTIDSDASSGRSDKDVSLRLLWEGDPFWDHDGLFESAEPCNASGSGTTSEISNLSAAVKFQSLLETEPPINYDQLAADVTDLRQEFDRIDTDISHLLHRSSMMHDSKQLYQSVLLNTSDFASEMESVCSLASKSDSSQFAALRRSVHAEQQSRGLLDLKYLEKSKEEEEDRTCQQKMEARVNKEDYKSPMTESSSSTGLEKSLSSGGNSKRRSSLHRSMMDSAIGTDLLSSDDDLPSLTDIPKHRCRMNMRLEAPIVEASPDHGSLIASSERSLEWFDDDITRAPVQQDTNNLELDIDGLMVSALDRLPTSSVTTSPSLYLAPKNCLKMNVTMDPHKLSSPTEWIQAQNRKLLCKRKSSRDLMVYAREQLPNNPQLIKVLYHLYKRRRLRRIGLDAIEGDKFRKYVLPIVTSMLYHDQPFFRCNSFNVVLEAIEASFKRCDFIRHWQFSTSVACRLLNDKSDQSVKMAIISCLKTLWHLQQDSAEKWQNSGEREELVLEAVRLLMVLRAMEALESSLLLRVVPRPFYAQLFQRHNPKELMIRLGAGMLDQMELSLLADTMHCRVEVFDVNCNQSSLERTLYPDKTCTVHPSLAFLRTSDHHLLPLFYVSAD